MTPLRSSPRVAWAGCLLLASACAAGPPSGGPGSSSGGCRSDSDCNPDGGSPQACVASRCLVLEAWPADFGAELAPSESGVPTPIELAAPKLDASGVHATFSVGDVVKVQATFQYSTLSPAPPLGAVSLALQPRIPGRPDIPFDGLSDSGSAVSWILPAGTIGRPATLTVSPSTSGDEMGTVHSFAVAVDSSMGVDVGMDPLVSITGRILSAAGEILPGGFSARAFARGEAVSNLAVVDSGTFVLLVSAKTAKSSDGLIVEVGPSSATPSDPTFVFAARSFPGNSDLGTVKLPPYTAPQQFGLSVLGDGPGGPPVTGARVRFRTTLAQSDPAQAQLGAAEFVADAMTDEAGFASVALLPGPLTPRDYEIAIVPPPGSPFATQCFADQMVGAGGGASSPVMLQPNKALARRPIFSGTVRDDQGKPVPNVTITATPGPDPVEGCSTTRGAPASLVSADGRFALPLDPGTYRFDYDPPAGAPVPRSTELDVTVGAEDVARDVIMPPGAVLDGLVTTTSGSFANATVQIFEPRCTDDCFGPNRTAPWLRGRAQVDLEGVVAGLGGHFRAVVAMPGPAPAPTP